MVPWGEVLRLGDERLAKETQVLTGKVDAYRVAARAYRALAVALREQGIANYATTYHYRSELVDRYALSYESVASLARGASIRRLPPSCAGCSPGCSVPSPTMA